MMFHQYNFVFKTSPTSFTSALFFRGKVFVLYRKEILRGVLLNKSFYEQSQRYLNISLQNNSGVSSIKQGIGLI